MKIDIKINAWLALMMIVFILFSFAFIIFAYKLQELRLNEKIFDSNNRPLIVNYDCNAHWQSGWYNCGSMQFSNITGFYCNGTLMCQNSYEEKK